MTTAKKPAATASAARKPAASKPARPVASKDAKQANTKHAAAKPAKAKAAAPVAKPAAKAAHPAPAAKPTPAGKAAKPAPTQKPAAHGKDAAPSKPRPAAAKAPAPPPRKQDHVKTQPTPTAAKPTPGKPAPAQAKPAAAKPPAAPATTAPPAAAVKAAPAAAAAKAVPAAKAQVTEAKPAPASMPAPKPAAPGAMPPFAHGAPAPQGGPRPPMPPGRPIIAPRLPAKAETFVEGDHVVYPTHGVGKVERIATEEIAGHKLELIHITFEENRMTLRVPVAKARSAGLRKLANRKMFDEAMTVLRGKARIKRTMWSRRAQEYEAKINSGDPIAIAEVVRDLHRNAGQPDQSFSERQIYEAAMDRLAAELAALDRTDKPTAATKLNDFLKDLLKASNANT